MAEQAHMKGDDAAESRMRTSRESAPWVLVAGGFHARGGMDKANAALAAHLLERGTPLHLVAHSVAPELAGHALVTAHLVARPAGSYLLGEYLLSREGRRAAAEVTAVRPDARVVVNGGNCIWPDINWVHYVHGAWSPGRPGAPVWFRVKDGAARAWALGRERRALLAARLVIANSESTREALVEAYGLKRDSVRVVYLGSDEGAAAVSAAERNAARAWLSVAGRRPQVAFVGGLGLDQRKGLDTLLRAWRSLCARPEWDADLIIAGGGRGLAAVEKQIAYEGLAGRVRLLGFTNRVAEVLAASDLLVSPARYEAYGLNVHEAVCRGVPAMVSAGAGVAELYPAELSEMLLPDAEDAADLAARLLRWRAETEEWKSRFAPFAARLRRRAWGDAAAEFVRVAEGDVHSAGAAGEALASCPA
ncbi:MAG TPA: glycosyltransferase [Pyrinomonadaceae bacterium]